MSARSTTEQQLCDYCTQCSLLSMEAKTAQYAMTDLARAIIQQHDGGIDEAEVITRQPVMRAPATPAEGPAPLPMLRTLCCSWSSAVHHWQLRRARTLHMIGGHTFTAFTAHRAWSSAHCWMQCRPSCLCMCRQRLWWQGRQHCCSLPCPAQPGTAMRPALRRRCLSH